MAGRSRVFDLAPELRAELDRLLRERRYTLDQIVDHLKELSDDPPSRSSIGRYAKRVEALAVRSRRAQEIADRLVTDMGPQIADGKGLMALTQVFQALAFDMIGNLEEDEVLDPENLHFLARSIKDIASAQKSDTDRALMIRREFAKTAAAEVEKVGKARGITADTVEAIKNAVLGVAS